MLSWAAADMWSGRKAAEREQDDGRRRESRRGQHVLRPLLCSNLLQAELLNDPMRLAVFVMREQDGNRWRLSQFKSQHFFPDLNICLLLFQSMWKLWLSWFKNCIKLTFLLLFAFFSSSQKSWRLFIHTLSGWRLSRRPNTAAPVNRSSSKMDWFAEVSIRSGNSRVWAIAELLAVSDWKSLVLLSTEHLHMAASSAGCNLFRIGSKSLWHLD